MICTVFSTTADPSEHWQSELLEYSFRKARQPGQLFRLTAARPGEPMPSHYKARIYATMPWNPHPYARDNFPAYDTASSVLQFLFRERADCTILLVDGKSVFQSPVNEEVAPGQAVATPWPDMPLGHDGPFGLPESHAYLRKVSVASSLDLPRIQLPILIHSRDLLKLAPRWLELMMLIRMECPEAAGRSVDADRIAYAVAAAEYGIAHEARELAVGMKDETDVAPILNYRSAVESSRGEIVWDEATYEPGADLDPARASSKSGHALLSLLAEFEAFRSSGAELTLIRVHRAQGVREARVLDSMLLEIPGQEDSLSLNETAAMIWELCDGQRSIADIVSELAERFDASSEELRGDIEATARQLQDVGALRLEQVEMA